MTERDEITVEIVRELVSTTFPAWSGLPVTPVDRQGWDNRTFRLGDALSVRLPSADGYVDGFLREQRTLELLRERVSFPIPRVVATGTPTAAFSRPWSIRGWLDGVTLDSVDAQRRTTALTGIADALAELLHCSTDDGPWAGRISAYRGCHVSAVGDDVEREIGNVADSSRSRLLRLWQQATGTMWEGRPAWVHGDVAPGNMLFDDDGRFVALIDFGQTCVGDPACDLSFAWLSCTAAERQIVRERIELSSDTWLRGAAWALWKTLITSERDMLAKYGRGRQQVLDDLIELV